MNAERQKAKTYRAAPGVCWAAQGNGILIIDEVARHSELLAYPDAAVWDMACRGHGIASIMAGIRWIMGDDWIQDCGAISESLDRWVRDGLLEPINSAEEVI